MTVVTLLTDIHDKGFNEFLKPSCIFHDLDLTVLHYDTTKTKYGSHRLKDILLDEYLDEVPADEIIIFSDGHDTAFLTNEKEILDKFNVFKSPLVFSAEINCWPSAELENEYPTSLHHFKYLNSGGFIGVAGFIKDIYKKYPSVSFGLNPEYRWSNQYFWHQVYFKNRDLIKIDHRCEIFFNTSPVFESMKGMDLKPGSPQIQARIAKEKLRLNEEITFLNDRIKSEITGTFPCHVHFPGPISKVLMNSNYFDSIKAWDLHD